jgi:EAL and modified HD-GYP domain-containing signal transduction protein
MSQFMVGRQPIFDAKSRVHGYELLFRGPDSQRPDGDAMTADVLVHSILDVGLDALVGDKLAFVNATKAFLVGEQELVLPPSQTVVEILADAPRDPETLAGCQRLAQEGYTLALDNYRPKEDHDPFLDLASIVKLDVLAVPPAQLSEAFRHCSSFGVQLIAEKVETRQQLEACQRLGFDLYQGYLLSRPEVVEGHELSSNRLTCLRIIDKLCDPRTSAAEVESIVRTDAVLSYQFLRAAGAGAAWGFFRRLSSVREAVVLLGERRIRALVMLILLNGAHDGSDEQLNIAMTRARMAELLAMETEPRLAGPAFTVGLVSALDLLLRAPLPTIVESMSLGTDLEEALLWHTGKLGDFLADVLSWELGAAGFELRSGAHPSEVEQCYLQALAWASKVCGALEPAA